MQDFHLGPHSFELEITDRHCKVVQESIDKTVAKSGDAIPNLGSRPRGAAPHDHTGRPKIWKDGTGWVINDNSIHNSDNQFQLSLMNLIPSQKGVEVGLHTGQCAGQHKNEEGSYYPFKGELKGTYETGEKNIDGKPVKYVKHISCLTDDGPLDSTMKYPCFFQPHMFLDLRATSVKAIKWNPPPPQIMSAWKKALGNTAHRDSMARATRVMEEYLDTCGEASSEDIIGILDGNGENRYAMKKVLKDRGIAQHNWPEIITFEKDAEVALANTIMFPEDKFIFTGADHTFNYKSEHNFVGEHYAMVEHLIVKDNRLYTQEMKERTKVFYFDYPGGPIGNQNRVKCKAYMERVLSKLNSPQLIIGVTLSYRGHGGMEISDLVPIDDFKEVKFIKNTRVKCGIYKRNAEEGPYDIGSIGSDSESSSEFSFGSSSSDQSSLTCGSRKRKLEVEGSASIVRKGKMLVNATGAEKVAIRDQQKIVAELRAQLEIAETQLRLMLGGLELKAE